MSSSVEQMTYDPVNGCGKVDRYCEFTVEADGARLEAAMVEEYGSKDAAKEEMLYLTIIAASRSDRTTLNAMACVRKYWRSLPEGRASGILNKHLEPPYWQCICGTRAMPLTDDTECLCVDIYCQEWTRIPALPEGRDKEK